MNRVDVLYELLGGISASVDGIRPLLGTADPSVERDVRLAAEALDDAACRLRVIAHNHTRTLFGDDQ